MAVRRLILAAAVVGSLALAGCDRAGTASAGFKAIDITGAEYARNFDLPDANGQRRTLADFKGRVTLVFFGFTHCPDVCPTTMIELAEVKKALGPDGARVQSVFITVDPERDTPELLRAYINNFDPSFVALRGSPEETSALAKHFKVFYAKVPSKTGGNYIIDHTAASFVFDANGQIRLYTRYGGGAEALKSDLRLLLDGR